MELIVRAVDVGSGNTKFVTHASATEIRCASFPSIAYVSSGQNASWELGERRRTVCIPIGDLFYEVGPDVALAADTFRARQLHDGYAESPEYLAFYRGALSLMKLSHIDLMVVGLPAENPEVSPFALINNRRAITGSMIGGTAETQEMLDYCAEHNIVSDVEVIPVQQVNEAYERMLKNDVRYRFVLDMKTL